MISKVSTFLGPNGLYRSGATPSLVLSLDSTNSMSYPPTGFTVSGGGTTHILDERNDIPWDGYGGNYLQGGVFQDSATPLAGWYLVDDNGTIRQVLGDSVWFSSGNPTPILNGGGWFMVLDGPYTISNTYSTSITFYESLPTVSNLYNGSNWFDISKRKNNGVLNDVTPLVGNDLVPAVSLSFNGTGSYISFTQSDGIPLGNSQYTIEAWINSNSYEPSEQGSIVGWGTTGVDNAANVLRLNGNGITNYWWNDDIPVEFSGTSSMIVGNWYHVVSTYDGTNRKLYLNGESKSTDTPTGVHNVVDSSNFKIGYFYTNYFNGKISNVKISDKALSDVKILSNFNTDKIKYGYEFGSMTFNESQKPYLISTSSDYIFGTNDFTIEAFIKMSLSNTYNYSGVISQRHLGGFNVSINTQLTNTSTPLIEFCSGSGPLTFSASNDTWYHTAISRIGGTTSYYVNGDLFAEFSDTTDYTDNTLVIGRYYTEVDDYYFNGVISNVRVINGTGLYSGNSITVPTPKLTATSNTKYLINSQKTTPTADLSGILQSVTSSNIGWTASLPYFTPPYVLDHLELYVDGGVSGSYPGSGTTLFDLSTNGFNMEIGSGSAWNSTSGGIIHFDGSYSGQGDLDGPTSNPFVVGVTYSSGYSMEVMVKFDSVSGNQGIFTFCGNNWGSSGYINLQLSGQSLRWEFTGNSTSSFFPTYTFNTGTWYHIVATYDGSFAVVYVNGTMIGSTSGNGINTRFTTAKFVLGSWDGPLHGDIGFTRFYSKPLLADDITANFNSSKSRFGL